MSVCAKKNCREKQNNNNKKIYREQEFCIYYLLLKRVFVREFPALEAERKTSLKNNRYISDADRYTLHVCTYDWTSGARIRPCRSYYRFYASSRF